MLPILFFITSLFILFSSKIHAFSFSNSPIDVVIPCVEEDLLSLDLCINGIRENGKNVRRIIVVSRIPLTDKAEWFNESNYPFSIGDVAAALGKHRYSRVQHLF